VPRILRKLPFFEKPTHAHLPDGTTVPVLSEQIVCWASLSLPEPHHPGELRRFPVSLDTGFNGDLFIPERYLLAWAGLTPRDLAWVGETRFEHHVLLLRAATIWLHPNCPGSRDTFDGRPPYPLDMPARIIVWPSMIPGGRRLPLLGVHAIHRADLRVVIDGRRRRVSLGTPWRFSPFA
jgi:hypothetical protein